MRIHLAAILVLVLATAVLARIPASLASSGVGGPMERSSFAKNLDHSQHHSKSHHSTSSGHHAKGRHSKVSTVTSPSTDSDAIDGAQRSSSEASSLLESPRPSTLPVTRHLPPVRRSSRRMMQLRRSSWASGACRAARTSSPCQLSSWPAPSLPNMILYIHASYSDRLSGITQPPSDVYTTWLRMEVRARISQHVG